MAVERTPSGGGGGGVWSKMLRSIGVSSTSEVQAPADTRPVNDGPRGVHSDVRNDGAIGQVPNAQLPSSSQVAHGGVKPWQTRTLDLGLDTTKKLVAQSVLAVMSGIPAGVLAPELRTHVEGIVGDARIGDLNAMKQVYARCAQLLGPDLVAGGLDVARAPDAGVLTVRGDRAKLLQLTKGLAVR